MAAIKVSVDLEGQKIAQEKLDAIYIQRARFTLQEMKNLGASILNTAFTELTTAEIAQIPDKQISQLLLANKLRLGKNRLNNLYADQYTQADQMWQKIIQDSIPGDFSQKVSRAHLVVTGINWRSAYQLLKKAFSLKQTLLSIEPDHIDASGVTVTEIMGMYEKPTAMKGTLLNVPHPEPVKKDHYLRLLGASHLVAHPNITNAIAMHQIKPTKNGLDILAGAYFPTAAPQELVDGHSLHLAIEMSNLFSNIIERQQNN